MITILALLVVAMAAVSGAMVMWLYFKTHQSKAVQTPAPLYFVRAWKPLTQEQIALAFRNWPDDERWKALWDLLSHHLEAELATQEGIAANSEEILQRSGRVQMLLFLRSQVLSLRKPQ